MIGLPPISIMGFGRDELSSAIRVPMPPARITHFIKSSAFIFSALARSISRLGLAERAVNAIGPGY
jgi:hypothetical protein